MQAWFWNYIWRMAAARATKAAIIAPTMLKESLTMIRFSSAKFWSSRSNPASTRNGGSYSRLIITCLISV